MLILLTSMSVTAAVIAASVLISCHIIRNLDKQRKLHLFLEEIPDAEF